ncbi:MAG: HD domain-containing protein [Acidobacteriota bacterium]|nr:HD domain-containing protein [Acidobacteriota bacterium]
MADSVRQRFEQEEDARLAIYAWRSADADRRMPVENEGRLYDYRSRFQRDRDRVVYSRAFRRLRQKAQAGMLPEYEDHRRNRLTHTLEVTQLARTVARALRLNEDLVEAIGLAHDLGQPPFGPVGTRALDDIVGGRLDGRGGPGLGDLGGFRRSWQSLRVVDSLEKRYDHPGLNLTDPVREGVVKCAPVPDPPPWESLGLRRGCGVHLEGQVVRVADRIATALHDLDDGLQSGQLELSRVERLDSVRQLRRKLGDRYPSRGSRFARINSLHRGFVHLLVTGAVVASGRRLKRLIADQEIESAEQLSTVRDEIIDGTEIRLPPSARRVLEQIEQFLEGRVRSTREADQVEATGRRVILGLFAAYWSDPTLLDDHVLLRFREATGVRYLRDIPRERRAGEIREVYQQGSQYVTVLIDHLAAMTDTYAVREHRRLLSMAAVPIPGAERLRFESESLAPYPDTPRPPSTDRMD